MDRAKYNIYMDKVGEMDPMDTSDLMESREISKDAWQI